MNNRIIIFSIILITFLPSCYSQDSTSYFKKNNIGVGVKLDRTENGLSAASIKYDRYFLKEHIQLGSYISANENDFYVAPYLRLNYKLTLSRITYGNLFSEFNYEFGIKYDNIFNWGIGFNFHPNIKNKILPISFEFMALYSYRYINENYIYIGKMTPQIRLNYNF